MVGYQAIEAMAESLTFYVDGSSFSYIQVRNHSPGVSNILPAGADHNMCFSALQSSKQCCQLDALLAYVSTSVCVSSSASTAASAFASDWVADDVAVHAQ